MKRMIHANLWVSEQVAKLSISARLLYIGMITVADDDGRLKGSSMYLRGQIFPYDDKVTINDVKGWIAEIVNTKLIQFYEVDGEYYIYHPKWTKYQTLRNDRKRISLIPEPKNHVGNHMATTWQPSDNQPHTEDKISKGKIREDKIINTDADKSAFGEFGNVKLKTEEIEKLNERLGERNTQILIEELSSYIASRGRKYNSHYATLLSWAKKKIGENNKEINKNTRKVVRL